MVTHIPRFASFLFQHVSYKGCSSALSILIGVVGWGCPKAFNIHLISITFCPLTKRPAVSASAGEVTTSQSNLHLTWIGPFNGGVGGIILLVL